MDTEQHELVITFPELSIAEANLAAIELRSELLNREPDHLRAEVKRTDERTQNAGETLVLIFGSGAALAVAEGIRGWLVRRGSRVELRTREGELIATGGAAEKLDVDKAVHELRKRTR